MYEVVVHESSKVCPATPTSQPCTWQLSNLDLIGTTYAKNVHYYKGPCKIFQLKESLSKVLVPFYPLAGILVSGYNGRYFIECDDSGVPFLQASTNARLENWQEVEHQLIVQEDFITHSKAGPLIQVQVTNFACGGFAIGWVISEMIVDGHSSFEFFKSWSEIHRGVPLSNPPTFNLGDIFKPRNPPQPIFDCKDYVAAKVEESRWASVNYMKNSIIKTSFDRRLFTINEANIQALIREIERGPYSYGKASSFEAMAALIWKCMTQARDLPDDQVTKYMFAVSCRNNSKRWKPVIPTACFGNTVYLPCLPARAGDIKSKHISYAASMLHDEVNGITMETFQSSIDWMQLQMDKGLHVGFNADLYAGKDVHCTSLYTFPVYDVDFGSDKPVHYSLVVDPWFGDGVAFMLPCRDGGRNRDISIAMPPKQMVRLLENELFLNFATEKKIVMDA